MMKYWSGAGFFIFFCFPEELERLFFPLGGFPGRPHECHFAAGLIALDNVLLSALHCESVSLGSIKTALFFFEGKILGVASEPRSSQIYHF